MRREKSRVVLLSYTYLFSSPATAKKVPTVPIHYFILTLQIKSRPLKLGISLAFGVKAESRMQSCKPASARESFDYSTLP